MNLPIALQPGERVVFRRRRTPVYMYAQLAAVALAALAPAGLLLWAVWALRGLGGAIGGVVLAVSIVWLAVWLVYGYAIWYRHQHDEWILTDQRLIDSYKAHWFSQRVSSADLVNVQDISVHKSGLLPSLFNFGDVVCQTAGTESRFVLIAVPRPADVLSIIDRTRDAARGQGNQAAGHQRFGGGGDVQGQRLPPIPEFRPSAAPPDHISER
jgi:hypothetical protein